MEYGMSFGLGDYACAVCCLGLTAVVNYYQQEKKDIEFPMKYG